MKHLLRCLLLLTVSGLPFAGEAQTAAPDTAKVGIWMKSLYDMDISQGAYSTNFWMWFIYKSDSISPAASAEITNAKAFDYAQQDMEKKNGLNWATQECHAEMKQHWDVDYFPFDVQTLTIVVEDAQEDASTLVYEADTVNSTYSNELELAGWTVQDFKVKTSQHEYKTTFGDPSLKDGSSSYPVFTAALTLKRQGWGLFFKLFTGMYVAFFISWLAFFVPPTEVDPRFGLSVGGLFGAVGNKYLVDSILPDIISTSLADRLHGLTFVMLLTNIVVSVISLYYAKQEKIALYKKIDRRSAYGILAFYAVINAFFIIQAL